MSDTPAHVQQLYSDFIMSKSVTERFRMGFDMINESRRMTDCSVARQHPDWSETEQKLAVIERMYRNDFSPDEMEQIKDSFRQYHARPDPPQTHPGVQDAGKQSGDHAQGKHGNIPL